MSKFKNENQNKKQVISQSQHQTLLSFSVFTNYQSGAVQRSVRNEETHRLRMGSSDCVLRGAYVRDPSHSSESSLPRFRRYSRILRYYSLFFRVPNSSSISSSSLLFIFVTYDRIFLHIYIYGLCCIYMCV